MKFFENDKVIVVRTESAPNSTIGKYGKIRECCGDNGVGKDYYRVVFTGGSEWFYLEDELLYADKVKTSEFINIPVKFKKLSTTATIPTYATDGSACFDLYAAEDILIQPGETKLVGTGLSFEIPVGYQMKIHPRSGISLKTPLRVANAPGCVDSDFRNEVKVILWNTAEQGKDFWGWPKLLDNSDSHCIEHGSPRGTYQILKGDRIAQAEVVPMYKATFFEVEELTETERGCQGFGHSGVR